MKIIVLCSLSLQALLDLADPLFCLTTCPLMLISHIDALTAAGGLTHVSGESGLNIHKGIHKMHHLTFFEVRWCICAAMENELH